MLVFFWKSCFTKEEIHEQPGLGTMFSWESLLGAEVSPSRECTPLRGQPPCQLIADFLVPISLLAA